MSPSGQGSGLGLGQRRPAFTLVYLSFLRAEGMGLGRLDWMDVEGRFLRGKKEQQERKAERGGEEASLQVHI